MTEVGRCALCGQRTKLLNSHIMPRFAIKWLKETSATGYIRQADNPNVRKQDCSKVKLLCVRCEARFSKWEKCFAESIFIPFQERRLRSFEYGEWLIYFAVSLAWRTAIVEIEDFQTSCPQLASFVHSALDHWRAFLLEENVDPGPYEHHVFFLDFIADAGGLDLPDRIHWYILRATDLTLAFSSKEVFAYTKLPGLIFWSGIHPARPEGWEGTLISRNGGVITIPQHVSQPGFGDFLLGRARIVEELMNNISERQLQLIQESLLRDLERTMASYSLRVFLFDKFWRDRKKGGRPDR